MTKQKGIRVTTYMSMREKNMLEAICNRTGENMSQMINALIMQEYYRLLTLENYVNPELVRHFTK